jgi:hypothetical protein
MTRAVAYIATNDCLFVFPLLYAVLSHTTLSKDGEPTEPKKISENSLCTYAVSKCPMKSCLLDGTKNFLCEHFVH